MSQRITAIYENGVLRPLAPLDLPEHSTVQLNVQTISTPDAQDATHERIRQALIDAGLSSPSDAPLGNAAPLSVERREELARYFAGDTPLADYISEDRDEREF